MDWLKVMAGGCKRSVVVLVGVAALAAAAVCFAEEPNQANTPEQQKAAATRETAQSWIQVGIEQYKRGLYPEAEQSFLAARDGQEYLSAEENKTLEENLTKAHQANVERQAVLKETQQARDLLNQGQAIQARVHYEKAFNSPVLTDQERKQIARELKAVDETIDRQRKEITGLYNRSVALYKAGELDKAREGFVEVAKYGMLVTYSDAYRHGVFKFVEVAKYGMLVTPKGQSAEDYLVKIDNTLTERLKGQLPSAVPPPVAAQPVTRPEAESEPLEAGLEQQPDENQPSVKQQPETLPDELVDIAAADEPVTKGQGPAENATAENARTKIIRAYAKAVVDDASVRVGYYIGRREFNKAVDVVRAASEIVSENRTLLGEELFTQYTVRLKQLASKIIHTSKS